MDWTFLDNMITPSEAVALGGEDAIGDPYCDPQSIRIIVDRNTGIAYTITGDYAIDAVVSGDFPVDHPQPDPASFCGDLPVVEVTEEDLAAIEAGL